MIIPFENSYREQYYQLLEQVFDSSQLAHGKMNELFEEQFSEYVSLHSCAVHSGGAALLALLQYVDVRGKDVIVPTNTFIATPRAVELSGGRVVFADCKREDLCLGVEQIKQALTENTKAVIIVHIGGHIAFDIAAIADFCHEHGLYLIEDCAHAHGALFHGKPAGSFGIGGAYSFYATKTLPLGEGGMVVSANSDVVDFAKLYRNYGKRVQPSGILEYPVAGFNFRMNEITAALGIIQLKRLEMILAWKQELADKYDTIFHSQHRLRLPDGMRSGYYKYITFDVPLKEKSGAVYDQLCHKIMGVRGSFPNAEWVKQHHACPPISFGWEHANKKIDELKSILLA